MASSTHYDTLGIKMDCSKEEIRKSYRKLSLKYHPDRPNGNKELFQKISQAYDILNDPLEKKKYDNNIKGQNRNNGVHMNSGFPDMDYLNKMFSMNSRNRGASASSHFRNMANLTIIKEVKLSLEESWSGTIKQMVIERVVEANNSKVIESESVLLRIPSGVDNGAKVIMKGKGHRHNSGLCGDVNVHVTVNNNTNFIRDGLDLILKKKITFKESLVGFKFEIKHISGKKYSINNFDGKIISDGYLKVVPRLGFKKEVGNMKTEGNLLIMFSIESPGILSKEIREKLNEILPD